MRPRRPSARPGPSSLVVLAAAAALSGCGSEPSAGPSRGAVPGTTATTARPAPTSTRADVPPLERTFTEARTPDTPAPPASWTARCPTATKSPLGCRAVRARVLTIQSLDPDGDGDLHVVAVGGAVTGPGLTVFDVRPSLRPRRDPRPGEWVTGAGPVFRGSYRQKQIQVDVFRVWRPRR